MMRRVIDNNDDIWRGKEFFCPNSKNPKNPCGDPVVGKDGIVFFTHRRLNFVRIEHGIFGKSAIYICPICHYEHKESIP